MSDKMIEQNTSVIDLKALSEPVCKLIESVSSAVGVWYKPRLIKREAKFEIKAQKIKALGEIEIEEAIVKRMAERLYNKELRRQKNLESITNQAIAFLPETVSKEPVDEDWVSAFYENCQDISDEQMQILWSKILAGEVAQPNSFSLRTLQFVKTMTKDEAFLFSSFCNYIFENESNSFKGKLVHVAPPDKFPNFMKDIGLDSQGLQHLESIGLIYMDDILMLDSSFWLRYGSKEIGFILPPSATQGALYIHVLTPLGSELTKLCDFNSSEEYLNFLSAEYPMHNFNIEIK